jgi:hypothetical protein
MTNISLVGITAFEVVSNVWAQKYDNIITNSCFQNGIIEIDEIILFHALLRRQLNNSIDRCQLSHQKVLEATFAISAKRNKLLFNLQRYNLNLAFPLRRVSHKEFLFFDSINSDYINITKNNELLKDFAYKDVELNLDIKSMIDKVSKVILYGDLDKCIIAGGAFSKYVFDHELDNKYRGIFVELQSASDVDIYIQDCDKTLFNKYLLLFMNVYLLKPIVINENDYKYNSFKVMIADSFLLNMIFVESKPIRGKKLLSVFELVVDFDFNLCKIFYSFKLESIFINVALFKTFHKLSSYQILNNVANVNYIMRDLTLYCHIFTGFKEFVNDLKLRCNIVSRERWKINILATQRDYVYNLKTFIDTIFLRTLKYYLKGFFLPAQKESIKLNILYFLNIFHDYLFIKIANNGKFCNDLVGFCWYCKVKEPRYIRCYHAIDSFCNYLFVYVSLKNI